MARSCRNAASYCIIIIHILTLDCKNIGAVPLSELTRCPTGSSYCGLDACTPPGANCIEGSCFTSDGKLVLCFRPTTSCVDGSCPQGSFCDVRSQQCQPETCAMRHALWCPQDTGQLQEVPCALELPQTQCFTSSSGRFTCNVSGKMLAATCGGRAVAATAAAGAAQQHQHQQQQLSTQYNDSSRAHPAPASRCRSLLSALSSSLSSICPSWAHSSSSSSSSSSNSRPTRPTRRHRHRRALQQLGNVLNLFPRDFVDINTQDFDPNRPVGGGLRGEFIDGFLSSLLQDSQATQQLESRLIGPSYGGPIPVASIKPVVNPSGNVMQVGANPGGLFARMGPGGAVLGSYGGGFAGPFNSRTGTYGLGGSYGMSQPYFGRAQGTAVFAVQNATYWQSRGYPTISYPCPQGLTAGTPISAGIPCGVALVSMPAEDLPTANGMPAAPQLEAGVGGAWGAKASAAAAAKTAG
jgi:ribosomal protein S27E